MVKNIGRYNVAILLRCLAMVFLLAFLTGCGPEADRTREAQQTAKPTEKSPTAEPAPDPKQQSPSTQVIESKPQAPDLETEKLYNELDKELTELKNVLDSLDSVEEKDLNTPF